MTTPRTLLASLALLAGLLLDPTTTQAAQSYDNCTDFIDTVPVTISTQGVWCLRQNVSTSITSGNAITVAGNNITIDCNDFKLGGLAAGDGSQAYGIYASNRHNVTVRHCGIRGFQSGIYLLSGAGHLVEDNRLDNNLFTGILVAGDHNLVQRNRVFDTGGATGQSYGYGIFAYADVLDNTVDGVFATAVNATPYGITLLGDGNQARGNRVRDLVAAGSGNAFGIATNSHGNTIENNSVVAGVSTSGWGIDGGSHTTCRNNTVVNFTTNYFGCAASSGNISLP